MSYETLRAMLLRDEDLRLSPYTDTEGNLTIGVGHNLTAKPISMRAALFILDDDIEDAQADVDLQLQWVRHHLSDARQDVVDAMCFNLGISRLLTFKKALAALKAGAWETAAEEMLDSKWARQVGDRAKRLAATIVNGG